ncbi:MAG: hypothetical protein ACFCUU_13005 [Cyclobacteriaceae bacterium]
MALNYDVRANAFNGLSRRNSFLKDLLIKCCLTILVSIGVILPLFSQGFNPYQSFGEPQIKRSPIRAILNKFSLTMSTGYGRSLYRHDLPPGHLIENANGLVYADQVNLLPGGNYEYAGVVDWLNDPRRVSGTYNPANTRAISTDTSAMSFKGSGYTIPFNLGLQIDISRFKIGGGIMYEIHGLNNLMPSAPGLVEYTPNFTATSLRRYYFTMGAMVYDWKGWMYNVDIQIGNVNYGKAFNRAFMEKGLYFNLGIPIEYEFSEYFWFFIRPSYDFKNYSLPIPTIPDATQTTIVHRNPGVYVQFGLRIKYPEIPRCPVKSCRVQLKHVHDGREFRGQPIWKKQNPKIGELYPKLHKQKNRNKRKISGGY